MTVVKKNPDIPMENPDLYLPTVMTYIIVNIGVRITWKFPNIAVTMYLKTSF